ncbi:MAG: hypothetical protein KF788_19875 [Piscinibacter sp.]|nr:hypothetical protein [Piscinibacter sp.]
MFTAARRFLLALVLIPASGIGLAAEPPLPERLSETGLGELETMPVTPRYPLWSDGAGKRRWLHVPAGQSIDASQPDAWQFPPGTRLWKEFAVAGRPVETRYIERLADGRWRFASYVWDAEGREARLAPERGLPSLPVAAAPEGRYEVPSRADCTACHEGAAVPVLGVGALQLADQLPALVRRGWLRGLPPALLAAPPRIAAASPVEEAALGYLHANCGHCHNDSGAPVPVRLVLAQSVADPVGGAQRVLRSLIGAPSRYRPPGFGPGARVVVPGRPQDSVLLTRLQSRHPNVQMPPLGTRVPDVDGLALVTSWINHPLLQRKDPQP